MINVSAMAYLKHRKYSRQDVNNVCAKIDGIHAARFDISPNKPLGVTLSRRVEETRQGHFPTCVRFVQEIVNSWDGPPVSGSFIMWLEDGMWDPATARQAPIIAFGKKDFDLYTFLMPDPAFIEDKAYTQDRKDLEEIESKLTWAEKKPIAFWRGASSGLNALHENWMTAPRIKLAQASQKIGDLNKLDAYISQIVTYGGTIPSEKLIDLGLVREKVPFADFLKYRYLIDVDGEFCAWRSYFLKLCSNSLVLKILSENEQWYYDKLIPWQHFIPISSDLSDIEDAIEWIQAHDDACHKIAKEAKAMMDTLRWESAFAETSKLIYDIVSCCTG